MNKRQAKKRYKKIYGYNPQETTITVEQLEWMRENNLTKEDIVRIGDKIRKFVKRIIDALEEIKEENLEGKVDGESK